MKAGDLDLEDLSSVLVETVERAVASLRNEIMTELAKRSVEYLGVHQEGRTYTRGSFTTFQGSLWHCNKQTSAKPGTSADWTLAVKCGRDGKDAR